VNIPPRKQISPLGAKGEVTNGPQRPAAGCESPPPFSRVRTTIRLAAAPATDFMKRFQP
jgi:hypothetical protein